MTTQSKPSKTTKTNKPNKENKTAQLKKRQKVMLQALRVHKGLVTHACNAANVGRTTHYKWLRECEDYKIAVDEIDDFVLDEIENAAMRMIEEGKNPAIIIFYLKTKGKKRGFVEKQEIEFSAGDMTTIRSLIQECDEGDEYEKEY